MAQEMQFGSIHPDQVDIAIIGGGMVGLSLATMLASAHPDWRIALIEQLPFNTDAAPPLQPSFDARSTAIAHGSATVLESLGLWSALLPQATAITRVHVSDRGHFLGTDICAAERGLAAVGYVVPNHALGRVLMEAVKAAPNITLIGSAQVQTLTFGDSCAYIDIVEHSTPRRLQASLAIVADGSDSPLRHRLGIHSHVRDYAQTAIIANVAYTGAHNGVAYERFTEAGPLALLPLGGARASQSALIWTLPTAAAEELLKASDAEFLAALQARFGWRLGKFTQVSTRGSYPLTLTQADEQVRSCLVLLGNAAHFLHPVAGQGFNLALRDCAALVETLREADAAQQALGELSVLKNYLRKQTVDQWLTIEFSDYLVRLFSSDNMGAIAARHLGLLSLELLPIAKKEFVAQTMGSAGRLYRINEQTQVVPNPLPLIQLDAVADNKSTSGEASEFDIIIVGAALVGASLACALADATSKAQALRIAIVEANPDVPEYNGQQFDPRVVALNLQSEALLRDIGVWERLQAERISPYEAMHVWDGEGTADIHFDAASNQCEHLGHIIENSLLVRVLRERLVKFPSVTLITHDSVAALKLPEESHGKCSRITLASGRELTAALVVAADGAKSQLRDWAGITTREWDYGHTAIVTTVTTELPHQKTAWQRFMRTGPLAFLPLQHEGDCHYSSIVWSVEHALAEQLMAQDEQSFCHALSTAFEKKLGRVKTADKRFAIKLRQCHARDYIRNGFALIGDAAHSIHPLAGQGVNLGLADVIALRDEIIRANNRQLPLTDYSILRRYQRARMGENLSMMAGMEMFKQLFGQTNMHMLLLRNIGLNAVNNLAIVKKWIVRHALGRA